MLFTESLKQNFEFKRMYRRGKSEVGPLFAVYCMKNGKEINRLGITTGGKLGKAVVRNVIRRRIKEAYRLSEYRMKRGYDIVVVARGRSVTADYHKIERDLLGRLKNLGILKELTNNPKAQSHLGEPKSAPKEKSALQEVTDTSKEPKNSSVDEV